MKNDVIVIAEAGVNHNGDILTAMRLVDAAAHAGADYIKFQTFNPDRLVVAEAATAAYQKRNTGEGSQLEMLRRLQLSQQDHLTLMERCAKHGIRFLSTAFDADSVSFLRSLELDIWKIPSGEITNLPMLRQIGAYGQKVILSTGMSTLDEVARAVEELEKAGTPRTDITLLHCTSEYPAPLDQVNLRAMDDLATLGCGAVGYSDHTDGITVPLAAVARGAKVVEKHLTLSREMEGPDHKASLEPDAFREMVEGIREVERALGVAKKVVTDAERANREVVRKSIVAARKINRGELLTEANLTVKRPGTGLSPMEWDKLIGRAAKRDYLPDEPIEL